MTNDFRKKNKNLIKRLVKEKALKLYTMKIFIGECSEDNFEAVCDLLLEIWKKMYANHSSIFFSHFAGFTRELIIEIDGETIRPYLYFILFASKSNMPLLRELNNLALFSVFKATKILDSRNALSVKDFEKFIVPLEEAPYEEYEKIIDNLTKPCVRAINQNERLEGLVQTYLYDKQTCSRGGIVSRKNLERNVALQNERRF